MLLGLWICEGAGLFYGMSLIARTHLVIYIGLIRIIQRRTNLFLNHRLGTRVPVNRRILIFLYRKVAIVKALLI
jgi:hypothetical protein